MFGKKRPEKMASPAEGRRPRSRRDDRRRKTYGFRCDPGLQAFMKALADELDVPLFALSEHALELGSMQIEAAKADPAEREEMCLHLAEAHVLERTLEKISRYDLQASDDLARERIRRSRIDRAARALVVKFIGRGYRPEDLEGLIILGARCRAAMANGWRSPPAASPRDSGRRAPGPAGQQPASQPIGGQEEPGGDGSPPDSPDPAGRV